MGGKCTYNTNLGWLHKLEYVDGRCKDYGARLGYDMTMAGRIIKHNMCDRREQIQQFTMLITVVGFLQCCA